MKRKHTNTELCGRCDKKREGQWWADQCSDSDLSEEEEEEEEEEQRQTTEAMGKEGNHKYGSCEKRKVIMRRMKMDSRTRRSGRNGESRSQ